MYDIISQVIIFVFGVSAIFMSQSINPNTQKWACIFGLTAQPFWYYVSFVGEQWGIFAMSFFYTFAWGRGLLTYWRKNNAQTT